MRSVGVSVTHLCSLLCCIWIALSRPALGLEDERRTRLELEGRVQRGQSSLTDNSKCNGHAVDLWSIKDSGTAQVSSAPPCEASRRALLYLTRSTRQSVGGLLRSQGRLTPLLAYTPSKSSADLALSSARAALPLASRFCSRSWLRSGQEANLMRSSSECDWRTRTRTRSR